MGSTIQSILLNVFASDAFANRVEAGRMEGDLTRLGDATSTRAWRQLF